MINYRSDLRRFARPSFTSPRLKQLFPNSLKPSPGSVPHRQSSPDFNNFVSNHQNSTSWSNHPPPCRLFPPYPPISNQSKHRSTLVSIRRTVCVAGATFQKRAPMFFSFKKTGFRIGSVAEPRIAILAAVPRGVGGGWFRWVDRRPRIKRTGGEGGREGSGGAQERKHCTLPGQQAELRCN